MPIPNDTYDRLYDLVKDKDYFVITTNVDHCFQRSGFDKKRLFYTQGDYGLLQSSNPHGASAHMTYENEEIMRKIILAQGFEIGEDNELIIPEGREISMRIPTELIPYCPDDGEPMTTNLRSDDKFVEDEGWHQAAERYSVFLRRHENLKVLFLEAAVGMNTPGIIQVPVLEDRKPVAGRDICLPELRRGLRTGRNHRQIHLHQRRYPGNPDEAVSIEDK